MTVASDYVRQEIHEDDEGVALVLQMLDTSEDTWDPDGCLDPDPLDVSAASSLILVFEKADGTRIEKTATFSTTVGLGTGVDGYIEFLSDAGFLTPEGQWQMQGRAVIGTGTHRSQIVAFRVWPNL